MRLHALRAIILALTLAGCGAPTGSGLQALRDEGEGDPLLRTGVVLESGAASALIDLPETERTDRAVLVFSAGTTLTDGRGGDERTVDHTALVPGTRVRARLTGVEMRSLPPQWPVLSVTIID